MRRVGPATLAVAGAALVLTSCGGEESGGETLSGTPPKGRFIEVTLEFRDSRTLTTLVPVERPTGPFDDITVPGAGELPAG